MLTPALILMVPQHRASFDSGGHVEFWAAVGAILGVVLFIRGFQMLRYKRLVLNTPESKVRSAAMGLVEIEGMAKGPQTIPAGISGDPCFYYRAVAWRMESDGRNRNWKRVADERLFVPFFLEDSTGRVLVNAQSADCDVHCNFKDEFGASFFAQADITPPHVRQFMMRYGLAYADRIRLEEYCIKPGYPLFVLGTLGRNAPAGPLQMYPTSHFALAKNSHQSKLNIFGPVATALLAGIGVEISGASALGVDSSAPAAAAAATYTVQTPAAAKPASPASSWSSLSMDETAMEKLNAAIARHSKPAAVSAAPVAAQRGVAAAVIDREPAGAAPPPPPPPAVDASGFELHPAVAIGKGDAHAPFTISSQSQREVVGALAWKSTLCIWGGPILTLAGLFVLGILTGLISN